MMRAWGAAVLAGLAMTGMAHAQTVTRIVGPGVVVASDFDGPYEDVGPPSLPPRYEPEPYAYPRPAPRAYGPPPPAYGPSAYGVELPVPEIMRIVRRGGYSPLGAPQQRGNVYTIAVIDPDGDDGRLVIDAYSGRIIRFVPADRYGARGAPAVRVAYGPYDGPVVRPPAAIPQARTVPLPKPRVAALPAVEKPTASVPPADMQSRIPAAPTAAMAAAPAVAAPAAVPAAKPPVALQPTQAMPSVQGLE